MALALAAAGCEGTWATPNQIDLTPQRGSNIAGIGSVRVAAERIRSDLPVGSDVDVQFVRLHDARRYVLVVEKGSCARGGTPVARFALYPYTDPSEGVETSGHVDVPIHDLLKNGYAIQLVNRRTNASVSCGDLQTDRPV